MKNILTIFILSTLFYSCKKDSFKYTSNKFYVTSVKEHFKEKTPQFIYISNSLSIKNDKGIEKEITSGTKPNNYSMMGYITWTSDPEIDPKKEITLQSTVKYYNENSLYINV